MTTKEQKPPKSFLTQEDMEKLTAPYQRVLDNIDDIGKLKPVSVEEAKDSHDVVFNNNKKRWKLKDLPRPH